MENRPHYALIGAFVLVAFVAALCFIVWLSGAQLNRKFDNYEVVFNGPVRGLTQGGEVRFNGLNVGEVTSLTLDEDDPNSVVAAIQVTVNTPVDVKSYARLEPLGLTGLTYIQIFSGGEGLPPMTAPGRDVPRIQGQMSQIDTFLDDGGSVIQAAQSALNRANTIMSADAIEDFHEILENINRVTSDVDASEFEMENLNAMIISIKKAADDVSIAASSVNTTAGSVDGVFKADVVRLIKRVEVTLAQLDTTLKSFDGAAQGTDDLIVDARDAINRLSNSGLTDLEETIDAIRRLVISLNRVTESLEQNPGQFIAGKSREVMEIPQ